LRANSPFAAFYDLFLYIATYLRDIDSLFQLDFYLDFPPSVRSPSARVTPLDLFTHFYADSLTQFLQFEHKYFCIGIPLVRCFPTYFVPSVNKLQESVDNLTSAFLRLKARETLPLSLAI
jgi:hypothetical protein